MESKQQKIERLYNMCKNILERRNPMLLNAEKDKIYFYLMGALEERGIRSAAIIASAFARHPNSPGAFSDALDYFYARGSL